MDQKVIYTVLPSGTVYYYYNKLHYIIPVMSNYVVGIVVLGAVPSHLDGERSQQMHSHCRSDRPFQRRETKNIPKIIIAQQFINKPHPIKLSRTYLVLQPNYLLLIQFRNRHTFLDRFICVSKIVFTGFRRSEEL